MYAFSFIKNNEARAIAVIKNEKKENSKILYLNKIVDSISKKEKSLFTIKKGKIECLPNLNIIEKIYISGPSGAGKSYWLSSWIKHAKKYLKYSELYVFSILESDSIIDRLNPIRIDLDESYIDNPMTIDEFENNSIIVFDDTDTIDGAIKKHINMLRDRILEIGRHKKLRILITSHIFSDFKATRKILAESNVIVFYPSVTSPYYLNIFLKTHAGFTQSQIEWIKKIKSRWMCLYCTEPRYIIWETGAILNDDIP